MHLNEEAYSADHILQRALQQKDEQWLSVISHLRHDWMNDIQVLYGYMRLNKYDKLAAFMETIKQKAAKESSVAKLGVTKLVVYLQMFRIQCPQILLEVDIEQELQLTELPVPSERVADAAIAVLDGFIRHTYEASNGEPQGLQLEWTVQDEELVLIFDYRGGYREAELNDTLRQAVSMNGSGPQWQLETEFEPQWAAITVRVPFVRE